MHGSVLTRPLYAEALCYVTRDPVASVLLDALAPELRAFVREEVEAVLSGNGSEPWPEFLTMKEASRYSSLSRSTLYRLVEDGCLRVVKEGGRTLLLRAEIDAHLYEKAAARRR